MAHINPSACGCANVHWTYPDPVQARPGHSAGFELRSGAGRRHGGLEMDVHRSLLEAVLIALAIDERQSGPSS